jgi:hypothetical protein
MTSSNGPRTIEPGVKQKADPGWRSGEHKTHYGVPNWLRLSKTRAAFVETLGAA